MITFAGVIRDHDGEKAVNRLSYFGHPSAGQVLLEIAGDVTQKYSGIRIAIVHRIGALQISEIALSCAVAAPHRAEAFAACAFLVDEIENRAPLWKEQSFVNGRTEWVGAEHD